MHHLKHRQSNSRLQILLVREESCQKGSTSQGSKEDTREESCQKGSTSQGSKEGTREEGARKEGSTSQGSKEGTREEGSTSQGSKAYDSSEVVFLGSIYFIKRTRTLCGSFFID